MKKLNDFGGVERKTNTQKRRKLKTFERNKKQHKQLEQTTI